MASRPLTVDCDSGPLSAEWIEPQGAVAGLVLAHGAGAGYRHANLVAISEALADVGVATLRFNFPFMEAGRRRVDARPAVARSASPVHFLDAVDPPVLSLHGDADGVVPVAHRWMSPSPRSPRCWPSTIAT